MPILILSAGAQPTGLHTTRTRLDFQSPNGLAPYTEIVSGGLPPYAASSSDPAVATVAQATSPNLWTDSDTLASGSTLTNLTKASGGPNGATDAEATGTGSPIGSNAILDRVVPVVMGKTYAPSFFIDPSQITNNNGSTPNVLTEFAGSTQNADGSYSNVDSKLSATTYTFTNGTPFTIGASIAAGSSGSPGCRIGIIDSTGQNRYEVVDEETTGGHNLYIAKYVNGVGSLITSAIPETADPGVFMPMGITITPGSPNTITAFVGGTSFSVTDSSLTLTSGTWHARVATNGLSGSMRNYAINGQVQIGLNTADNLTQILQQYVALNTTTAGRYATAAWTCPTNLVVNSDSLSGFSGSGFTLGTGGPGGAVDAEITGTGVQTAYSYDSETISVTAGTTYNFSAWCDPSNITAGFAALGIWKADGSSAYIQPNLPNGGSAGRYSTGAWTCPSGVTQVLVRIAVQATINNGQKFKFSQPMLEPASSASGYYISSQNPQVHVYAELLSSSIVASGQKFKISQPMLALSTYDPQTYIAQTAAFLITPIYRGKATITYTDSTP